MIWHFYNTGQEYALTSFNLCIEHKYESRVHRPVPEGQYHQSQSLKFPYLFTHLTHASLHLDHFQKQSDTALYVK